MATFRTGDGATFGTRGEADTHAEHVFATSRVVVAVERIADSWDPEWSPVRLVTKAAWDRAVELAGPGASPDAILMLARMLEAESLGVWG